IETCYAFFLDAFDVPKSIRDVLKIEANAAFLQACAFSTPLTEKMSMRPLGYFMSVRSGERVLLSSLATQWSGNDQYQKCGRSTKSHSEHAHLQNPARSA